MKLIAPSYYPSFKCIGGSCRHSCCVGWEIDIDEKTSEYYKSVGGAFGKRLAENIDFNSETTHFRLCDGERCPFLNSENLCDIILNLGEDRLCQICDDHPRYRNFYSDRTEIGLGLCCEAAAELIIGNREKNTLVTLSDDGAEECADTEDELFLDMRDRIFGILQDRAKSIDERISTLFEEFELSMPQRTQAEWVDVYLSLERLDERWEEMLLRLKSEPVKVGYSDEIACEQLLVYFIYRHLADGLYDGMINERIKFSVLSLDMILAIASANGESIAEIARAYSSEIEYSEDNIEKLLSVL